MGFKSLFTKLAICVTLCMVVLGTAMVGFASRTARLEAFAKAKVQLQITAKEQAEALHQPLNSAMVVARTLAQVLGENRVPALRQSRAQATDLLRRTLQGNHDFLAVYTLWEPDAFDGGDAPHARQPGADASGRFLPYWSRDRSGLLRVEPITGYQVPGGDVSKRSQIYERHMQYQGDLLVGEETRGEGKTARIKYTYSGERLASANCEKDPMLDGRSRVVSFR